MSRYPDPFLPRETDSFQPLGFDRQPSPDLAKPDDTQTNFMQWLRSAEAERECHELGLTELSTEPELPPGCYLQPDSVPNRWQLFVPCGGYRYTVYKGGKAELLKIVESLAVE